MQTSKAALTAGCVQRENSPWGQAKCGKCSHAIKSSFLYKILCSSLLFHSPASHVYHSITAQWPSHWWGQDSSLTPFPTHRKGLWLFLTWHCCPTVPWRFIPARSGSCALPEGDSMCFTVDSALRTVWRGYGAIKSWRKRVMNTRVLKANSRTDSSLSPCGNNSLPFVAIPLHFGIIYASCYCPPNFLFAKFEIQCKIPNQL